MTISFIDLGDLSIEVTRKPIKHMHLRIYPSDGLVRVSAPYALDEQFIQRQLESKKSWIHQQVQKFQNQKSVSELKSNGDAGLQFLGKNYPLIIQKHSGKALVQLDHHQILLSLPPETTELKKQALLEQWQRQRMTELLPKLIEKWSLIIGVEVNEWRIKQMKTRWGSCNTRAKRIWLNLKLIQKPLICLEYVIVHELIHLLEPSHNRRFYALMQQFMPAWESVQKTLES